MIELRYDSNNEEHVKVKTLLEQQMKNIITEMDENIKWETTNTRLMFPLDTEDLQSKFASLSVKGILSKNNTPVKQYEIKCKYKYRSQKVITNKIESEIGTVVKVSDNGRD